MLQLYNFFNALLTHIPETTGRSAGSEATSKSSSLGRLTSIYLLQVYMFLHTKFDDNCFELTVCRPQTVKSLLIVKIDWCLNTKLEPIKNKVPKSRFTLAWLIVEKTMHVEGKSPEAKFI